MADTYIEGLERDYAEAILERDKINDKIDDIRRKLDDARQEPLAEGDLSDILEKHREDIVDQIQSLEDSLPFVGLKYYRDQLLPQVVGELKQTELRQLMDLMVNTDLVEVYPVENPNNKEFNTAAIRLVPPIDEGIAAQLEGVQVTDGDEEAEADEEAE